MTMMVYNYQNSVKVLLDKWTAAGKEFSAFDVTQELRRLNKMAGIQFSIYHSSVRNEVHTQMANYAGYDKKVSACGAYQVYFFTPPVALPLSQPTVAVTTPSSNITNVTLTKGKNGKFTVPAELSSKLHKNGKYAIIHVDENGKHKETIERAFDKSNVRFRLPNNVCTVRLSSDNRVLVVEGK